MAERASKVVVITGATRGLGRAMAEGFLERGHVVAGCGRSADRIAELRERHQSAGRFDELDVTDAERVAAWAENVIADFGPPDLLINNAAIIHPNAPLWTVPLEDFHAIIDINIKGMYHTIRAFLSAMIERGSGVVVNFSSYWGRSVAPEVAGYCATKWAVEGLTRALAQELPSGLAAVPFNPGVIDTEMLRSCFGPSAAGHTKPQDWAEAAVPFLLRLGPKENGKPVTAPGQ